MKFQQPAQEHRGVSVRVALGDRSHRRPQLAHDRFVAREQLRDGIAGSGEQFLLGGRS